MEKLEEFKKLQKEIILLNQSLALLEWDQETYIPKEGSKGRSEQISLLSSMIHDKVVSDKLYNTIKELGKEHLSEIDSIMVKRMLHDVEKEIKLPRDFVEELSRVSSRAFSSWTEAREKNDFGIFEKDLDRLVELKKKEAEYRGYTEHPYDALLDEFEEGMTTKKVSEIFEKLKEGLISLLRKIESSEIYKKGNSSPFSGVSASREKQIDLAKDVAKRIGLGENDSRMDFSVHPFTNAMGSKDVRITTAVREDPMYSFNSTVHESGHALYELDLPEKFEFTVLHDAPSFGIHESQSRFWENMVGRGKPFWKFYFDKFKESFGLQSDSESFYRWFNRISPGLIRTEADEIHYCLHMILRFEIEKGLLDGSLRVKELPKIWNRKFKESFGVEPKKESEGVLQDVHWSQGYFGYFPTYALGTIYAAQLYEAMKKDFPKIDEDISKGDFGKISKWLNDKVHKYGRTFLAEEIIQKACGKGLDYESYLDYLDKKYSEIYGL